jgi:hypothetical protein
MMSYNTRSKGKDSQDTVPAVLHKPFLPSEGETRALLCLIEGDRAVFEVQIAINKFEGRHPLASERHQCHRASDSCQRPYPPEGDYNPESSVDITAHIYILQVDLDLDARKDSLRQLAFGANEKKVQVLKDWKPVLDFWLDQPRALMVDSTSL